MAERIVILSPLDLKPGSKDPKGRVVKRSEMHVGSDVILVGVDFEDGTSTALSWPSGSGWVVDGRTG